MEAETNPSTGGPVVPPESGNPPGLIRRLTQNIIGARGEDTKDQRAGPRILQVTLGRLFRLVGFVVQAVIPRKRPGQTEEDSRKLLVDIREDEESLRDDVRSIAETLRAAPVNRGSYTHPDIPDILENVALANWDSQASLPLDESDAQRVLNALQEELDHPSSVTQPPPDSSHTRKGHLRVLYWFALRTGRYPQQMFVLNELEHSGRTDYGSGGMNDILQGTYNDETVALKHPRVIGMVQPSRREKLENVFYRHSLVAFNMRSQHVLPVLGVVDDSGYNGFCMVSPWMAKGNLRAYLGELVSQHGLSGQELVKKLNHWLLAIAEGLAYLHSFGFVHGDIRAANVLVDSDGNVRLTAFGSTAIVSADDFSHPGQGGSVAWVAPELIDPEKYNFTIAASSRATDVYSFACTCVELYSGQQPFSGLREAQILNKVLKGQRPKRPSNLGEEMPNSLWQLVCRCWDQHPSRRPPIDEAVAVLAKLDAVSPVPLSL